MRRGGVLVVVLATVQRGMGEANTSSAMAVQEHSDAVCERDVQSVLQVYRWIHGRGDRSW